MLALTSIFLGIVPMVLFALLIWRIDCWETDPVPLIVGAFYLGSIHQFEKIALHEILMKSQFKTRSWNF